MAEGSPLINVLAAAAAKVDQGAACIGAHSRLPGAAGTVSFIASMTQPFCAGCNRLRLTADGALKVCLFGNAEVSLRDAMREGASDEELLGLVAGALYGKHAAHAGMHAIASSENRPMTTIGG